LTLSGRSLVKEQVGRLRPTSARPSELFFDLAVSGRLRRKLVESCVEQALGVLVASLAAPDEAKVCDHLSLELLVSQLPKEIERLLEVLNRHRDAAAGMNEGEGEVVERQRLGAPVAKVAHDRKRGAMLHDSPFVIPVTSKLRAELVESMRPTTAVVYGRLWLPLVTLQEAMGPPRSAARVTPQTSP
jgi:hypothetical protein